MRILYIHNTRIPTSKAHGFQICKMCEQFAGHDRSVELIVPDFRIAAGPDPFAYYSLKKNFKVTTIPCVNFLAFEKYLGRASFYLNHFWFLFKLAFIPTDKDDIIFSRVPSIIWLFKAKGYFTCYECHDWFSRGKRLKLRLLKKTDRIITTNNHIKKEFVKNGFKEESILAAPHGVDHSIFSMELGKAEAINRLGLEPGMRAKIENRRLLLYTGSFKTTGAGKGIDDILAALKILGRDDLCFVAVGGSMEDIADYEDMARQLSAGHQAIFMPRVEQKALALWQKAADLLLMPFPKAAHYEYFMTPLKMFEYLAAQKPIIASDLPSIREVLTGQNAVFCKPGDPKDLSEKIKLVLDDHELARRLSQQAGEDIRKYTWENRAKRILDFMQK